MPIEQRFPDMTDAELESLNANAVRLQQSGTPAQQTEAGRLLPLLETVLLERRAIKLEAAAEKKRATKRKTAATRAGE